LVAQGPIGQTDQPPKRSAVLEGQRRRLQMRLGDDRATVPSTNAHRRRPGLTRLWLTVVVT
jgi:hypothetical protein